MMWTLFTRNDLKPNIYNIPWKFIIIQAEKERAKYFFKERFNANPSDFHIFSGYQLEKLTAMNRGYDWVYGNNMEVIYTGELKKEGKVIPLNEFLEQENVIVFHQEELTPERKFELKPFPHSKQSENIDMEQFIQQHITPKYIEQLKQEIDKCLETGNKERFLELTEQLMQYSQSS